MLSIAIVAYSIWLFAGMIAGFIVLWYVRRAGLQRIIGFRDVWSRVPTGGPLVLLLILDARTYR